MSDWRERQRRKKREELRLKDEKRRQRMQQADDSILSRSISRRIDGGASAEAEAGKTSSWYSKQKNKGDDLSSAPKQSSSSSGSRRKDESPIKKLLRQKPTISTMPGTNLKEPGKKLSKLLRDDDSPTTKRIDTKWLDSSRQDRRPETTTSTTTKNTIAAKKNDDNPKPVLSRKNALSVLADDSPISKLVDKKWLDPPKERRITATVDETKTSAKLPPKGNDDDDSDSDGSFDLLSEFRKARQQNTDPKPNPTKPPRAEKEKMDDRRKPPPPKSQDGSPPARHSQTSDTIEDSDDTETTERESKLVRFEETRRGSQDSSRKRSSSNAKKDDENDNENVIPHNPIALEKQEQQKFESITVPSKADPKAEDDLWMDSEPDEEESESAKKPKKQRGKTNTSKKSPASSSATKKRKRPSDSSSGDFNTLLDNDGDDDGKDMQQVLGQDEDSLRSQLHPDLPDAPFGPYELKPLVLGGSTEEAEKYEVPAPLSRYLAPFQREGIDFMYRCLEEGTGVIMGDEMGLGKTMQVLSLLTALYRKSGTAMDLAAIQKRKNFVRERLQTRKQQRLTALFEGRIEEENDPDWKTELNLPDWYPVMILVPPTLIQNWKNEFARFSHFSVATYRGDNRSQALESLRNGTAEILLTSHSLFKTKHDFNELNKVAWKLVVIDEFHTFKNKDGYVSAHLRHLKKTNRSQILGMTGTLMQNDHNELWNLVDLVETDYLGSWEEFKSQFSIPIKIGRTKIADETAIQRSARKVEALNQKMKKIMIARKKEEVLRDQLPEKTERLVLCELSTLQKQVYKNILQLPDFQLVKTGSAPCDCSVNALYFKRYQKLKSPVERLEYYRKHKDSIVKRRSCCYMLPLNPNRDEEGQPRIDPDAALWRMQDAHQEGEACEKCPLCCMFPAFIKLDKVANHLALVQPKKSLATSDIGSPAYTRFMKELEFAKVALPPEVVEKLPGASLTRKDGIMDRHFDLSGKLKVLDSLLAGFQREDKNKTLVFSYSTQTLDLIQNYVRSKGFSFLRMDGTTNHTKRQEIADTFNSDPNLFLLLLSTKAMGLGLNLTSANKVIIFDVEWNPSWDQQAQDRAYRIGQKHDVQVVRLVSQGTVDELKYLRQLYKVQLKQETLQGDSSAPRAARMFRGVQGDKYRKGELFGTENLLKFKDGCFLDEIWKKVRPAKSGKRTQGLNIHETSALAHELGKLGETRCEELLHDDIGELDEAMKKEDTPAQNMPFHKPIGVEEQSTNVTHPTADIDELERGDKMDELGAHALNHEDLFREDRGGAAIEMGDEGFDDEMGGATQNAVAVYEERGEDFAEDTSDNDVGKIAPTCLKVSVKGDQNGSVMSRIKEDGSACLNSEEGAINDGYPAKDRHKKKESASKNAIERCLPSARRDEGGDKKRQKKPAPHTLKLSLVGQPPTTGIKTTFSVADIPIPTYKSPKSKGKKKKRKRKANS